MMFSFLCRDPIASFSSFVMLDLGGLALSKVCLSFHLSSSAWAWGMFKTTSSTGDDVQVWHLTDGCGEVETLIQYWPGDFICFGDSCFLVTFWFQDWRAIFFSNKIP